MKMVEGFGKKWLQKVIVSLVVMATGVSGIGAVVNGVMNIASGSPIQEVVKDVATDAVKNKATEALSGAVQTNSSFGGPKYKMVSYKKSNIFGYLRPGWDSEVYGYNDGVFIGNRTHNKPKGVNLKWNNRNAMDFEIGQFRKENVRSGDYIAYNSKTFTFVAGNVDRFKLNGYILEYDEYYNKATVVKYKKGKRADKGIVIDSDNTVQYKNLDKDNVLATFDTSSSSFVENKKASKKWFSSNLPDDDIKVSFDSDNNKIDMSFDDTKITISCADDTLDFTTDKTMFNGNAFKFNCKTAFKNTLSDGHWINYDYEVANKIGITQDDGTVGEVKLASEEDLKNVSDDHVNIKALSVSLIKTGAHATVELLVEDKIGAINSLVEVTTGSSVTDRINDVVDDAIDKAAGTDTESTEESSDSSSSEGYDSSDDEYEYETFPDGSYRKIKKNSDSSSDSPSDSDGDSLYNSVKDRLNRSGIDFNIN